MDGRRGEAEEDEDDGSDLNRDVSGWVERVWAARMADECDYAEIITGGELGFECLRSGIGCAVARRSNDGKG